MGEDHVQTPVHILDRGLDFALAKWALASAVVWAAAAVLAEAAFRISSVRRRRLPPGEPAPAGLGVRVQPWGLRASESELMAVPLPMGVGVGLWLNWVTVAAAATKYHPRGL